MDETPERFDWRDHAGKVGLASPCFAAAVSWALMLLAYSVPVPTPADIVVQMILVGNAAVAAVGSAIGGLSARYPLRERIALALAGGLFGFVTYCVLFIVPAVIGSIHR